MKFILALWIGKLVNFFVNIIAPTRGSNISGAVAVKIDKNIIKKFKIDPNKTLFITGTNGKSSTNNLINHIADVNDIKVVTNLQGANLLTGVATTLIKASSLKGKFNSYDFFVFETDERYLRHIYEQLPAGNILITNLQKDQVQRNGDLDFIWRKLAKFINQDTRLFLNNEDPGGSSLLYKSNKVYYYSVDKHEQSFTKNDIFPTRSCPICHHEISYEYYNVDSVGPFECTYCRHKSQSVDKLKYRVTDINFSEGTFVFQGKVFKMPYNMPHMLYNYAAALLASDVFFGLDIEDCKKAFENFVNIDGRFEKINYHGKEIRYLRVKQENPDTLQTAINFIANDDFPSAFMLSLSPLEDFKPYYHNAFYTYDCDFSKLKNSKVKRFIGFYKDAIYESVLRFRYAGIPEEKIEICDCKMDQSLLDYIENLPEERIYLICKLYLWERLKFDYLL